MKRIIAVFYLTLSFANSYSQGWQDVGSGVRAITNTTATGVYAMCADTINNLLYVGGTFDSAGSEYSENVAKWDGANWHSMPTEQGPGVDAMVMYKGNLYVGGNSSNGVTEWNGSQWTVLPLFNGGVNVLYVFNDTLYAGGSFTKSGNTTLNYIAKWDGTNWLPVGSGFNGYASPSVNAMYAWNGKLYAGGFFDESDTETHIFSIARWDDSIWNGLKSGIGSDNDSSIEGFVFAIDTFQGNLYVGGDFGFAGGKPTSDIVVWNGNNWILLGQGTNDIVQSFGNYNNKLYVGGGINSWDGSNWDTVGTGISSVVYAIAVFDSQLYVGGVFNEAGTIPANYIARWSPDTTTVVDQLAVKNNQVIVYPNPASSQLTFNCSETITQLQIEDVLGQPLLQKSFNDEMQRQIVDVSTLPQGIYFYRLTSSNSEIVTGKFVKE